MSETLSGQTRSLVLLQESPVINLYIGTARGLLCVPPQVGYSSWIEVGSLYSLPFGSHLQDSGEAYVGYVVRKRF